jgi:hypothetical protein
MERMRDPGDYRIFVLTQDAPAPFALKIAIE